VELPVVPMNRWVNEGDPKRMTKTYQFRRPGDRNVFVRELLDYEEKEGHSADIFATESSVTLKLYTRDVNQITELDKEYSRFADSVYKDITMTPDKFSKSGD
jgi:pterin-4a-carbinolamine dehydratase